ncbi:MAG: Ig-like domain-containing protein [Chlorobiales bacterium]|nr:Ig-like domain-containing protein [Chlorobiales bacterium]
MATRSWTGSTGADNISISQWGEPRSGDVYNFNGLDGNDTLYLNNNGKTSYNTPFLSGGFTIAPVDANGVIVVSGASSGGTKLTFNLTSIETLVFSDKTVTLSYGTPAPPTDTTPPTISAYSPSVGSTGITVGSNIVITFSETVQKGAGLIELHSGSATGALVASYDAASSTNLTFSGNTLTINPTGDLANGTHYFVTLAAGSIKDLAGNNYAGTTAYDFSTIAAPDTTPPTVSAFSPAIGAAGIAVGSDIVLTFSEAVQRGTGVIELHSGSATGTLVASYDAASSTNLNVSGNTLTINPTADLVNGAHYFVTLAAGSIKDVAGNHYAGTTGYDFSTSAAVVTGDTTPPTISTYSPADGATGIAVGSDIVITFSEAVQRGTGLIELHSGSATGALVASYDAASSTNLTVSGNTLTLNPTADLANGAHYFVTLAAGSIKDVAGNHYAGTTGYDFSTSAAVVKADITPPTIVTFSPVGGANDISVGSDIVLAFSEAIQKGTGTIAIHSDSATGPVVASSDDLMTESISISGSSLTINPTHDLAHGTHYFVTFGQGSIHDLAGNDFVSTMPYDFSTVPLPNPVTGNGNSSTEPVLAGVGILGVLAWFII